MMRRDVVRKSRSEEEVGGLRERFVVEVLFSGNGFLEAGPASVSSSVVGGAVGSCSRNVWSRCAFASASCCRGATGSE